MTPCLLFSRVQWPATRVLLAALLGGVSLCAVAQENAGILDQPVTTVAPSAPNPQPVAPDALVLEEEELAELVQEEIEELEELPLPELETRAESGERAAQVVLGTDFAEEAAMLAFAPAAANDALSDAARWYSLAASSGFPGAPSLDQAGVRFYPIRIQREHF